MITEIEFLTLNWIICSIRIINMVLFSFWCLKLVVIPDNLVLSAWKFSRLVKSSFWMCRPKGSEIKVHCGWFARPACSTYFTALNLLVRSVYWNLTELWIPREKSEVAISLCYITWQHYMKWERHTLNDDTILEVNKFSPPTLWAESLGSNTTTILLLITATNKLWEKATKLLKLHRQLHITDLIYRGVQSFTMVYSQCCEGRM